MHILSPETDNCPSWISGRERMTVENISWSISTKECCRPRRGLNPRPPGLQSDGASNWATEAGNFALCILSLYFSVHLVLRLPHLGKRELNLSVFRTFVRFALVWFCMFPLICLRWAAACDYSTPWTFLVPFLFIFNSFRSWIFAMGMAFILDILTFYLILSLKTGVDAVCILF